MANVPITVAIAVAPLPDTGTWFANSAAWTAYWAGQGFSALIPVATSAAYGVVKAGATTVFNPPGTTATTIYTVISDPLGNGVFVNAPVPSDASFEELKADYLNLKANYQNLKTALIAAGLISA